MAKIGCRRPKPQKNRPSNPVLTPSNPADRPRERFLRDPITPQSEVLETLEALMPWETTGMTVLQAESEVASINMVYGGAASGKAVMTSSSSPGVSLMQEGISYLAASELPALIVNVMRGGPKNRWRISKRCGRRCSPSPLCQLG